MGVNRYNDNEWYTSLYMGTAFNYTKEQNRKHLEEDIRKTFLSDKDDNMKIIAEEFKTLGGNEICFKMSGKTGILVCGLTTNEDYYYLYYDIQNNRLACISGVDSPEKLNTRHEYLILDTDKINKDIDDYLLNNYYYEVPFTPIFKTNSWNLNYIKNNPINLDKDINFKNLFSHEIQ